MVQKDVEYERLKAKLLDEYRQNKKKSVIPYKAKSYTNKK